MVTEAGLWDGKTEGGVEPGKFCVRISALSLPSEATLGKSRTSFHRPQASLSVPQYLGGTRVNSVT